MSMVVIMNTRVMDDDILVFFFTNLKFSKFSIISIHYFYTHKTHIIEKHIIF